MLIHQRRLQKGRLPTTNRPALDQAQAQAQAHSLALTTAGIQHMDARVMLTLVRPLILVLTGYSVYFQLVKLEAQAQAQAQAWSHTQLPQQRRKHRLNSLVASWCRTLERS